MQEDLINSEIFGRAACLAEFTSNPKSFFNCPDLHGGPGLPEGSFRSGEMDPPGNLKETITLSEATGKPYQEDVERLRSEPDCIVEKWRTKLGTLKTDS